MSKYESAENNRKMSFKNEDGARLGRPVGISEMCCGTQCRFIVEVANRFDLCNSYSSIIVACFLRRDSSLPFFWEEKLRAVNRDLLD